MLRTSHGQKHLKARFLLHIERAPQMVVQWQCRAASSLMARKFKKQVSTVGKSMKATID